MWTVFLESLWSFLVLWPSLMFTQIAPMMNRMKEYRIQVNIEIEGTKRIKMKWSRAQNVSEYDGTYSPAAQAQSQCLYHSFGAKNADKNCTQKTIKETSQIASTIAPQPLHCITWPKQLWKAKNEHYILVPWIMGKYSSVAPQCCNLSKISALL